MNGDRVAKVEVYVIEAPLRRAFWMASEAYTAASEVFLTIQTEGGLTGYGQAHGNPLEDIVSVLRDELIPAVLGAEVWATSALWRQMFGVTYKRETAEVFGQPHFGARLRFQAMAAIAALDIALWDVKAKASGLPLYRFLGSEGSAIPVYASGGYYPSEHEDELGIDELLEEVGAYVDEGFSTVKVKAGRSVEGDVERVAAIRHEFPDVGILIDANAGWSYEEALRASRLLEAYSVGWIEEPLRWYYTVEDLGRLARASPISIAAGEQEPHKWACAQLVDRGGIRFLQFDCTRGGGITEWLEAGSYAAMRGVSLAPHHDPQIHGHLVAQHAAGILEAFPNPQRDPLWQDFYSVRPDIKRGELKLLDEPGLGIEPDRNALKRWGRQVF